MGEILPTGVHDIWCRRTPTSPWSLQIMIDDAVNAVWAYRRDTRIRRPVEELDGDACNGAPRVLTAEVQLLQKSTTPRPKDGADFRAVNALLGPGQRQWLRRSLALTSPSSDGQPHDCVRRVPSQIVVVVTNAAGCQPGGPAVASPAVVIAPVFTSLTMVAAMRAGSALLGIT